MKNSRTFHFNILMKPMNVGCYARFAEGKYVTGKSLKNGREWESVKRKELNEYY